MRSVGRMATMLSVLVAGMLGVVTAGASATATALSPPAWPVLGGPASPDPFSPLLPPILGPGLGVHVSDNWFGYERGVQMHGGGPFRAISAEWVVPQARPHRSGQAEAAADWIGIGGGCIDTRCTRKDPTLIQTGTIDAVSRRGSVAYQAWYELIPAGPQAFPAMTIAPGDRIRASLTEQTDNPDLWTISMRDLTSAESVSKTVAYDSHRSSADWIEETPTQTGPTPRLVALPTLTQTVFTNASLNGGPAGLADSEATILHKQRALIGVPTAPFDGGSSFAVCAWTSHCT